MKPEPIPISGKTPRDRFYELGKKIMSASKDEIDARDKKWHSSRSKKTGRRHK